MVKARKVRSSCTRPFLLMCRPGKCHKDRHCYVKKKLIADKKEWENATCPICLEYPHNAILLLCTSFDKGCRPFMCSTSRRFSNCLRQYKKAHAKMASNMELAGAGRAEMQRLSCPLCRSEVKGTVLVEDVRRFFNSKRRSCMHEGCSYVGSYKQLRKHVDTEHPLARPRAVDPKHKEKWNRFECERERSDVISTIMSSTPGAVVVGDYVLEPGRFSVFSDYESDSDDSMDDGFFVLDPLEHGQGLDFGRESRYSHRYDTTMEDEFWVSHSMLGGSAASLARRFVLGRPRQPSRHRGRLRG